MHNLTITNYWKSRQYFYDTFGDQYKFDSERVFAYHTWLFETYGAVDRGLYLEFTNEQKLNWFVLQFS
jgi:hypothetical protein